MIARRDRPDGKRFAERRKFLLRDTDGSSLLTKEEEEEESCVARNAPARKGSLKKLAKARIRDQARALKPENFNDEEKFQIAIHAALKANLFLLRFTKR